MACICNDPGGKRRILFKGADGKRKSIRLGKVPRRDAEAVRLKVEKLASARITGHAPDRETSLWLSEIGNDLHQKLVRAGLAEDRDLEDSGEVVAFIDAYIEEQQALKERTIVLLTQTKNDLKKFLASINRADMSLQDFTAGHAIDFRKWLMKPNGRNLGDNTTRRKCGRAKQFFQHACHHKIISDNPFRSRHIPTTVRANKERQFFIDHQMYEKMIEACPCNQWRLLIALARYGGLRTPSEPLLLKWSDVNWERSTILIHSPKTEHHEGKETRLVPMFPELKPHLEQAFHDAKPGTEYVITRYRRGTQNLGTQLKRIVIQAGLKPWPKLWQNLRASRETELVNSFPIHVVCNWIGNSQAVAIEHYLQITDEHFVRATGDSESVAQCGAAPARKGSKAVAK